MTPSIVSLPTLHLAARPSQHRERVGRILVATQGAEVEARLFRGALEVDLEPHLAGRELLGECGESQVEQVVPSVEGVQLFAPLLGNAFAGDGERDAARVGIDDSAAGTLTVEVGPFASATKLILTPPACVLFVAAAATGSRDTLAPQPASTPTLASNAIETDATRASAPIFRGAMTFKLGSASC